MDGRGWEPAERHTSLVGGVGRTGHNGLVRTPLTYAAGLALAVISLVGVAGCGQPEQPTEEGTVSVPIQPTITAFTSEPETSDTSAPGAGGLFDLGDLLTTDSCEQAGGVWSYRGTFTNETDEQLDVTIAISLASSADLSLLTVHEVDLTAPAGETVPVEVPDFYSDQEVDPTTVQCLTGVTDKGQ